MVYNQDINLDLNTRSPSLILGAKQFDNKSRSIVATILQDGIPINIPSNAGATYRIQKPNGTSVWNAAEVLSSENKIRILFTTDDLDCSGRNIVDILLTVGTYTLGTTNFILDVQSAPIIDNAEEDEQAKSYLQELVDKANEIIEDAQAWAEGKRGSSELVEDGYILSVDTSILNVSLNWETFKAAMSHESGKIVIYTFQYSDEGWIWVEQNIVVDMSELGFTIIPLDSGIPMNEQILLTAQYQDEAWENHAKYYAEMAAASAATISADIAEINSELDTKLKAPYYGATPPTSFNDGDYWVDTNAQTVLQGRVVGSDNLKIDSIYEDYIHPSAITANKIASGALESRHFFTGAVTHAAVASNAIDGTNIIGRSISELHLAENAVGSLQLQNDSVKNRHLAEGAVGSENIDVGAVNQNHIAQHAITSYAMASGAIGTDNLINQVVTQNKMAPSFIKFGVIPGHNVDDTTSNYGRLKLQTSTGEGTGFIFITGPNSRGIVSYYCTNTGNTGYSSFIGYAAASSSAMPEYSENKITNLTLESSQAGWLCVRNDSPNATNYMAILFSDNTTITITP